MPTSLQAHTVLRFVAITSDTRFRAIRIAGSIIVE
jgi:hypothetical protein